MHSKPRLRFCWWKIHFTLEGFAPIRTSGGVSIVIDFLGIQIALSPVRGWQFIHTDFDLHFTTGPHFSLRLIFTGSICSAVKTYRDAGEEPREPKEPPGLKPPGLLPPGAKMPSWLGVRVICLGFSSSRSSCLLLHIDDIQAMRSCLPASRHMLCSLNGEDLAEELDLI